jgi:hypothetical protein
MIIHYEPWGSAFETVEYQFEGEKIIATVNGKVEEFDFSAFPDGKAEEIEHEILDHEAIFKAERIDGILHVTVVKFMPIETLPEDRMPYWEGV